MCLLSYFPGGILPDLTHLKNGADENPDGHGWAIVIPDERRIITGHGMHADSVIAEFGEMRARYPHGPALFHSRWGTGGSVDEYNCHPFTVAGDARTVVAHNGVLGAPDGKRCDTRAFAEDVLGIRWKRFDRPGVRRQIERYLGFGNKIVILTVNPRYAQPAYIFNEDLGDWIGEAGAEVWHSNNGWKPVPAWWRAGKYTTGRRYHTPRRYYPAALLAREADGLYSEDEAPIAGAVYSDTWGRWGDCEVCFTVYGVDPDTGICTDCGSCSDCSMPEAQCDCYTPGRSAHAIPASTGTGAGKLRASVLTEDAGATDSAARELHKTAILAEAQERLARARGESPPTGSPAYPGVPTAVASLTPYATGAG